MLVESTNLSSMMTSASSISDANAVASVLVDAANAVASVLVDADACVLLDADTCVLVDVVVNALADATPVSRSGVDADAVDGYFSIDLIEDYNFVEVVYR
jgi:hypothetical protein